MSSPSPPVITLPPKPLKQKMAGTFQRLGSWFTNTPADTPPTGTASINHLFAKTDPATDGEECLHDCDSCSVRYPRGFKIDDEDVLYGEVKGWSTHLLVGTGKTDWVRDVADEEGSVMEAVGKNKGPSNGRMMLSASNIPTPHDTHDYSEPTTGLLLPSFTLIDNILPSSVPSLLDYISTTSTTTTPLTLPSLPSTSAPGTTSEPPATLSHGMTTRRCPHEVVILMCSQRTRDARCGQSAPLLRKELERHLRPLGLFRDLHDERPGGVGIYFISHVGGHKYSANVMVYRRPNAFGEDSSAAVPSVADAANGNGNAAGDGEVKNGGEKAEPGAGQCIWLARIKPEDCENLVRYTVLKGKVVKPESQLRGGFDRTRGVMSW